MLSLQRLYSPVTLQSRFEPVELKSVRFIEETEVIPDVPGQAFSDPIGVLADLGNPLSVTVNVTTDNEDLTITLMGPTLTGTVDITFNGITLTAQDPTGEFTFSNVPSGFNEIIIEGNQAGSPNVTSINVVSSEPGLAVVPGLAYSNAAGFVAQNGNPLNLPVNVTTNNQDLEVQLVGTINFETSVTFNGVTITDIAHNPHFIFTAVPSGLNTIDIEGTGAGGPTITQVIVSTWTPPNLPGVVYSNPNGVLANAGNPLSIQVNVTTNGEDLQLTLSGTVNVETTVSINGSSVTAQGDSDDFVFTAVPNGIHTITVEGTGAGGPTITQIEGVVYVPPIPADYDDNDYSIDYRV